MEVKNMAYWKRKNGVPEFDNAPTKFNAGLRKASAEGKLDDNPKFKAAVDNAGDSPNKFLGALVADKVGGKLADRGGLMGKLGGAMQGKGLGGALLNPLAAIKNKLG
tara:strand:- start:419 stop:739 length:321 start_codon:yes stop_codon:yes gene_type:complete